MHQFENYSDKKEIGSVSQLDFGCEVVISKFSKICFVYIYYMYMYTLGLYSKTFMHMIWVTF